MKILYSSKKSCAALIMSILLIVGLSAVAVFGAGAIPDGGREIISWGLHHKGGQAPPQAPERGAEILAQNGGVYIAGEEKKVYLTFDLGYEAGYTERVLDTLSQNGIKAIFFITGNYLEKETGLIGRMISDGHCIGNHTYYHRDCAKASFDEVREDIMKMQAAFKERYGIEMKFYRPPQGKFYGDVIAEAASMGLTSVLWSFAYEDWGDHVMSADTAVSKIMARLHPGEIMLLHIANETNPNMLPYAIEKIRAEGYSFGDPAELARV